MGRRHARWAPDRASALAALAIRRRRRRVRVALWLGFGLVAGVGGGVGAVFAAPILTPKVVQESLGHARIGTTLDLYAHVIPAARRDAAEALERLLG